MCLSFDKGLFLPLIKAQIDLKIENNYEKNIYTKIYLVSQFYLVVLKKLQIEVITDYHFSSL